MVEALEPKRFTRADWEELFREATRGLDPWALDLVALIGRFREFLAQERVEMRVPGRMVLASSVLLRMKSDQVKDGEEPPTLEEAVDAVLAEEEGEAGSPAYVAPELVFPLRRLPRRRPSVAELERALLTALAKSRARKNDAPVHPEEIGIEVEEEPFTLRALRLLRRLLHLVNGQRVIPFSAIAEDDPEEKVARLMELLHLAGQGKISLRQEEFLGEILIEVPDGAEGPG